MRDLMDPTVGLIIMIGGVLLFMYSILLWDEGHLPKFFYRKPNQPHR